MLLASCILGCVSWETDCETEIHMQKVHWGVVLGTAPVSWVGYLGKQIVRQIYMQEVHWGVVLGTVLVRK